jgi:glycosyltransferase involved in cell wall biosynthesis
MKSVAHVCTVDITARVLLKPQLLGLRDAGWAVTVICAPGPGAADLEREGLRHVAWPSATRAWDPKADVRAFTELVRIFRSERFDVVHTHNPKPGLLGRVAARVARVPRVLNTVHGFYAAPSDPLGRRIPVMTAEWIAARFSDLELYQSREDLDWARRLGVTRRGRSALLGNGVDLDRFPATIGDAERASLRAELGIPSDDLVVTTVGRLVREKGIIEFIEAARAVRRIEPNVSFVAIGPVDVDKSDMLPGAVIESARDDVIFGGWREDLPRILAITDVFVLASWREGMPRSAIEAAASGLPAVLTDIRGCREIVRDGVEGRLVPPRAPGHLTAAILESVRDPEARRRMGKAARSRAESEFDERRIVSTIVGSTNGGTPGSPLEAAT